MSGCKTRIRVDEKRWQKRKADLGHVGSVDLERLRLGVRMTIVGEIWKKRRRRELGERGRTRGKKDEGDERRIRVKSATDQNLVNGVRREKGTLSDESLFLRGGCDFLFRSTHHRKLQAPTQAQRSAKLSHGHGSLTLPPEAGIETGQIWSSTTNRGRGGGTSTVKVLFCFAGAHQKTVFTQSSGLHRTTCVGRAVHVVARDPAPTGQLIEADGASGVAYRTTRRKLNGRYTHTSPPRRVDTAVEDFIPVPRHLPARLPPFRPSTPARSTIALLLTHAILSCILVHLHPVHSEWRIFNATNSVSGFSSAIHWPDSNFPEMHQDDSNLNDRQWSTTSSFGPLQGANLSCLTSDR
ncbi:hypothetical protein DFH06DRAFT_1437151 [Mycena polygramma]|nr:hypothetical protein DFH06DRAFT_1437151 [Mycena polygramma]